MTSPAALSKIIAIVARHYQTTPRALLAGGREEPRVTQRQIAITLAAKFTPLSNRQIAEAFGRKDDQTVAHAVRTVGGLGGEQGEDVARLRRECARALKAK